MVLRSRRPGPLHSLVAPVAIAGSLLIVPFAVGQRSDPEAVVLPLAHPSLVHRWELAASDGGSLADGRRLLTLAQLSDVHLIDEGSPLRTEFLDPWMGTAYRPQDGLTPHVLERMTAAVRAARSPVTGRGAELVITTGDNTDTGQENEVRWFIDLLDGGLIDPDSGVPGTCGTGPDGPRSTSWATDGRGYDPDGSGPGADGAGYDQDPGRNLDTVGRDNALPDHPGLREAMNATFAAGGLRLPWYASFGNHDALVQGNAPLEPELMAIAGGCTKVMALTPEALAVVGEAASAGGRDAMLDAAFGMMAAATAEGDAWVADAVRVPGDPARIPVTKRRFIAEHFRTTGWPIGHGFGPWNVDAGEGYYAVHPVPGVRLIALDTINEAGGHQGNIDADQFAWLHGQLLAADRAGELAIAFAHHTLASMVQAAPGAHLGGADQAAPPCPTRLPEAPPATGEPVRCLFLRHPSLVAFIDGHEHRNRITAHARPAEWGEPGGFWEITTASHIEWPQQARLVELIVTHDRVAIVTAIIDHASPGSVAPGDPLDSVEVLAGVARELSHGDPQGRNGHAGTSDPSGSAADRDTVLLLPRPRAIR